MQANTAEQKFSKIISRRNTYQYKKYKVSSKFVALFIIGLAFGISYSLTTLLEDASLCEAYAYTIKKHFDNIFSKCISLSDYSLDVLKSSMNDIRYLFYVFVGGFTYFCFYAAGLIVFAKGLTVGYATASLILLSQRYASMIPFTALFIIYGLVSSSVIVGMSSVAYLFSFEFRAIKRNRSVLRRAPIAYRFVFSLLLSLGGIITVNFLYCFFACFIC